MKAQSRRQLRFILFWRRQRHRRSYACYGFGSFNARIKLRYNRYIEKAQKSLLRLTATGSSAHERVSTSFCSWSRSVGNSAITRWNTSGSVVSSALLKTRIFIWVENGETPQLAPNGKSITCTMDNSVLLVVSRLSSYSSSILSSTSRSKDQPNSSKKNWEHYRIQCCMRETDADRSWQTGHGESWTSRRDEQGRSNARHSCLVTALQS